MDSKLLVSAHKCWALSRFYSEDRKLPGICAQIPLYSTELTPIFKKWARYSGDPCYPIFHYYMEPRTAFYVCSAKWGRSFYADSRRNLAAFMACQLRLQAWKVDGV